MASSIFAKAKAAAPATTGAKKNEKVVVPVGLGDKLKQLQEARDEIASLEAQVKLLEGDIKPVAKTAFLSLLERTKARPDSFVLESNGGKLLVIVQDKYLKMTPAKMEAMEQAGLSDLVKEETTYSFDPELLQKYERQISDAISKIKGIPAEDRDRLITATVQQSVKKGALDRLPQFNNPEAVFQLIEPVIQLKNQ